MITRAREVNSSRRKVYSGPDSTGSCHGNLNKNLCGQVCLRELKCLICWERKQFEAGAFVEFERRLWKNLLTGILAHTSWVSYVLNFNLYVPVEMPLPCIYLQKHNTLASSPSCIGPSGTYPRKHCSSLEMTSMSQWACLSSWGPFCSDGLSECFRHSRGDRSEHVIDPTQISLSCFPEYGTRSFCLFLASSGDSWTACTCPQHLWLTPVPEALEESQNTRVQSASSHQHLTVCNLPYVVPCAIRHIALFQVNSLLCND